MHVFLWKATNTERHHIHDLINSRLRDVIAFLCIHLLNSVFNPSHSLHGLLPTTNVAKCNLVLTCPAVRKLVLRTLLFLPCTVLQTHVNSAIINIYIWDCLNCKYFSILAVSCFIPLYLYYIFIYIQYYCNLTFSCHIIIILKKHPSVHPSIHLSIYPSIHLKCVIIMGSILKMLAFWDALKKDYSLGMTAIKMNVISPVWVPFHVCRTC